MLGLGAPAVVVALYSQTPQEKGPPANTSPLGTISSTPLTPTHRLEGIPQGLLVTCSSQHCRLLLSLMFSSYA